jgi:hypothetical protein
MSKTNNFVFTVVQIVSWVIFVGLCIEAGAMIVNFVFSLYKPELVQHLYQKLNLSAMYASSPLTYYSMYSFIMAIAVLKAILFYVVIKLVTKIDLTKPFDGLVSKQIYLLSYHTFSIGIVSFTAKEVSRNLENHSYSVSNLDQFWADSQAFILMAAVIYVIAIIFARGVAMQNEIDLTV